MAKSIVDYLARWLALKFLDTASAKKYHTEELVERSHRNGDLKASDIAMLYGMKHNEHQAASTISIAPQNALATEKKVVEQTVQKQQEGTVPEAANLEQLQKDQIKQAMAQNNEDAPICHQCGAVMVRNGSCYKCLECGTTTGCS